MAENDRIDDEGHDTDGRYDKPQGIPKSDRRVVFPLVDVELEGLGSYKLFYRNRDLEALEERFGSLDGFERASIEQPFHAIPYALWLGLRHDPDAPSYDTLRDQPPRVVIDEDVQAKVEDALLAALGVTREEAEEAQAKLEAEGGARPTLAAIGGEPGGTSTASSGPTS